MNQRGFAYIAVIFLIILVAGVAGYFILTNQSVVLAPNGNLSTTNEAPTDWQVIDADSFVLSLPPGWKFNKLQGKDSYVGEFAGDGAKLRFDYGWYSNPLADDNDPDHVITYETIGGYRAKIVVPKVTGIGTTGVYFEDLGGGIQKTRFSISGQDLTGPQQETVIKMFRTLEFK